MCPLADYCDAYQFGSVDQIPNVPTRKTSKKINEKAYVLTHKGKLLVVRRQLENGGKGFGIFRRVIPDRMTVRSHQRRLGVIDYSVTNHKVTCRILAKMALARLSGSPAPAVAAVTTRNPENTMTSPGRKIARLAERHFSGEGW